MAGLELRREGRAPLSRPCGFAIRREPSRAVEILAELIEYSRPPLLIAVGDVVARNMLERGVSPSVAIVDYKTQRARDRGLEGLSREFDVTLKCANPPGTISPEAWGCVAEAVASALGGARVLVEVDGEEDLLAIPAALTAPPRSFVVYGLRREALVVLPVTDYLKSSLLEFVSEYFALRCGRGDAVRV